MNGVHDMGGMHGMGPVQPEKNEPVFHARWEGRVFALDRLVRGKWNSGASRYQKELIPPAVYLRISYFERVLAGFTALLVKNGLVTRAEIESGKPARGSKKARPLLPVPKASVRSRGMCTQFALRRANCGVFRLRLKTRSLSTCGTTTSSPPDHDY